MLKIKFIVLFIITMLIIVYLNYVNKNSLVQKELNEVTKALQINFDITSYHNLTDAKSINMTVKDDEKVLKIISQALDADDKNRDILRDELYAHLYVKYKAMRQRGILQFQFVFPDTVSFLRMHKPSKYGDYLGDVRYSFFNTNKTHKPSFGFEQGRTAHAFRNVFPLFDANERYIGCYEISFTSESIQNNLTNINKIHSHFLVNKNIFDSNTWERKYMTLKYIPSIENENYMFTITNDLNEKRLDFSKKNFIEPNREFIKNSMSKSEKFAFYEEYENKVRIIAFLPIKNIQEDRTLAYIVSYTDSTHISDILLNYNLINIFSFIFLLIISYLVYSQIKQTNILKLNALELQSSKDDLAQAQKNAKIGSYKYNIFNKSIEWSQEHYAIMRKDKDKYTPTLQDFISLVHPDDVKFISDSLKETITTLQPNEYEYRLKFDDEIVHIISTSQISQVDSNGNAIEMIGTIQDITSKKLLEIKLKLLNEHLKEEVEHQTDEILKKDKIVQEQSKLAAMGEMVGSIAHQWRQPLNSLNINIENLDDDYADGLIDAKFIDKFIEKQTDTIQFMSHTIDDFRNFFRVDKIKNIFSVKEAVEAILSIQSAQFKNYNITVELKGEDFRLNTIESEFKQIILNIISNSKDAIVKSRIPHGKIGINIEKNCIIVSDNAGGIPQEILDRIFEPYFTTKEQGEGTGIGLYMSKIIMEKNIGGTLMARNADAGAEFIMRFSEVL